MKTLFGRAAAGLALGVLVMLAGPVAGDNPPDGQIGFKMLVEVPSPLGFEETLERIEANAKELGWK